MSLTLTRLACLVLVRHFLGLLGQCISVKYPRLKNLPDHVIRNASAARNNEA